jgi:hypothetical protein
VTGLAAYRVVAVPPNEREARIKAVAAYEVTEPGGHVLRLFATRPVIEEIEPALLVICRECGSMNECRHALAVQAFAAQPTTPSEA